jgi:hypothetical protein
VAVQVEDDFDLFLFVELGDIVFYAVHFRKCFVLIKLIPLPIQIMPHKIRPVVPNNHPIRIHHRNNLKNKVLPQKLRFLTLPKQKLHKPLTNIRSLCFARVLPGHNDDNFFCVGFSLGGGLGDGEGFDRVVADGSADLEFGEG